jgi:hypothetical protein
LANLIPDSTRIAGANEEQVAYAMARIEVHYFRNNRYEPEDQLLRRVDRICHVPATIVQGRYDLLCPPICQMFVINAEGCRMGGRQCDADQSHIPTLGSPRPLTPFGVPRLV